MEPESVRFDAPPGWVVRRLRETVWILLVLAVFAFLIVGANRPANPYLLPAGGKVRTEALSGFGAAALVITPAPGLRAGARSPCALVAASASQQERGLMGQTSLHGFAGMVFRFDQPTEVTFYMKHTLIPLTVAWFGPQGNFLASADMPPCPEDESVCPTYSAGVPYQTALEVPRGGLAALGIGPGAAVQVGGPCSG